MMVLGHPPLSQYGKTKENQHMEFEIDNRTPRDRIDPELLRRLMEANNEGSDGGCGCRGADSGDFRRAESGPGQRERMQIQPENGLRGRPLAMVYAPIQEFRSLYEPEEALEHGTIFRELDFPWYPTACKGPSSGCGCRRDGVRRG